MNKRQKLKNDVYLNMAVEISKLSKDEDTQIGAVIVAQDGTPVSWGYNGTVSGFRDDVIPHNRKNKQLTYYEDGQKINLKSNKYPFMCHAEFNALEFGDNEKLKDATLYVTGMPCKECAKHIAANNLQSVVVLPSENKPDKKSTVGADDKITKFIFAEQRIELFIGDREIKLEVYDVPPTKLSKLKKVNFQR